MRDVPDTESAAVTQKAAGRLGGSARMPNLFSIKNKQISTRIAKQFLFLKVFFYLFCSVSNRADAGRTANPQIVNYASKILRPFSTKYPQAADSSYPQNFHRTLIK